MKEAFAIIELGISHGECLYSQIRFLSDAGHPVHLICSGELSDRIGEMPQLSGRLELDFSSGAVQKLKSFNEIKRYLRVNRIETLVFNTVDDTRALRALALGVARKRRCYGTVHNIERFASGVARLFLNQCFDGYFVLDPSLCAPLKKVTLNEVEHFSPIYFDCKSSNCIEKDASEFWVCIPGELRRDRKDYDSLILQCSELRDSLSESSNVRFIILGPSEHKKSDGAWLKAELERFGLASHFITFDYFIDNPTFHTYLANSDVVLPLIHPNTASAEYYRKRVSGAFNLALAHKIPLMMEENLAFRIPYDGAVIEYSADQMLPTILNLSDNREKIEILKAKLTEEPSLEFAFQQRRYLELCLGDLQATK